MKPEVSLYEIKEAARYLHMSDRTLRSWVKGRPYPVSAGGTSFWPPLIEAAPDGGLSFLGFIEASAVAELRRVHGVRVPKIRAALHRLAEEFGEGPHPLARREVWTDGSEVLTEQMGQVVSLSEQGQQLIQDAVAGFVRRVEWSAQGLPQVFYPRPSATVDRHTLSMNPEIRAGKPVVIGTSVPTWVIADRFSAGDDIEVIMEDLSVGITAVQDALRLEGLRTAA